MPKKVANKTKKAKRFKLAKVDDLRGAPYNPRDISATAFDGLKTSLIEFGDISGIVWNARTGNLVAGHQRVAALRERYDGQLVLLNDSSGYWLQPEDGSARFNVRIVEWDELKEKSANVAANSPLLQGIFTPALAPILEELEAGLPELCVELRIGELTVPPASSEDAPPNSFNEYGDDIATQHCCPKCGYEWSGKSK